MKKIWGKGKRQLTKALAGFMAALMVVTLVPVSSIPVKAASFTASSLNKEILAGDSIEQTDAINFGIVAKEIHQKLHAQTNYAVKKYVMTPDDTNNDPDLLDAKTIPYYAAEIEGKARIDKYHSNTTTILYYVGAGQKNKVFIQNLENRKAIVDDSDNPSVSGIVDNMIQSVKNKSDELKAVPGNIILDSTKANGNNCEVDTTSFDDNAVIFVTVPADSDCKDIIGTVTGGLTIKKKSNQVIVFNIFGSDVKLCQFKIQVNGTTLTSDGDMEAGSDKNNFLSSQVMGKIIWNMPEVETLQIQETAGTFLAFGANPEVNLTNTSTGWMVTNGTFYQKNGEWHFPYTLQGYDTKANLGIIKDYYYSNSGVETKAPNPSVQAKFELYEDSLSSTPVQTVAVKSDDTIGKNTASFLVNYPTSDKKYYIKEVPAASNPGYEFEVSTAIYRCTMSSSGSVKYEVSTDGGTTYTSLAQNVYPTCKNTKDMSSSSEVLGSITVQKTVAGVEWDKVKDNIGFSIVDSSNNVRAYISGAEMSNDATHSYTVSNLPLGTYKVVETEDGLNGSNKIGTDPKYYSVKTTVGGVLTNEGNAQLTDGTAKVVDFKNEYSTMGSIKITKKVKKEGTVVAGWEWSSISSGTVFNIIDKTTNKIVQTRSGMDFQRTTDESGCAFVYECTVKNLPLDHSYEVVEAKVGFEDGNRIWGEYYDVTTFISGTQPIALTSGSDIGCIAFTNTYTTVSEAKGSIEITKKITPPTGMTNEQWWDLVKDNIKFEISADGFTTVEVPNSEYPWVSINYSNSTGKIVVSGLPTSKSYSVKETGLGFAGGNDTGTIGGSQYSVTSSSTGLDGDGKVILYYATTQKVGFTNSYVKENSSVTPTMGGLTVKKTITAPSGIENDLWNGTNGIKFQIKQGETVKKELTISDFTNKGNGVYETTKPIELAAGNYTVVEVANGLDGSDNLGNKKYTIVTTPNTSKHDVTITAGNTVTKEFTNVYTEDNSGTPEVKGKIKIIKSVTGDVTDWTRVKDKIEFAIKDSNGEVIGKYASIKGSNAGFILNSTTGNYEYETDADFILGRSYTVVESGFGFENNEKQGTIDSKKYKVTVNPEATQHEQILITIPSTVATTPVSSVTFVNKYTFIPTGGDLGEGESKKKGSVTLLGEKKLTGDTAPEETYQFVLKEGNKEIATVTSKGAGKFEFVIDYEEAGTHKYVISEKKGSTKGMTYSTKKYNVKVNVEDDTENAEALKVLIISTDDGNKDGKKLLDGKECYTFTNKYKKPKTGGSSGGSNGGSSGNNGSGNGSGGNASGIGLGSGGSLTGSASGSAMDPILIRKVFIDGKTGAYDGERSGCYFTLFTDPSCRDEYAIADAKDVEAIWSQADGQWNLSMQSFIVPAGNVYYLKEVKAPSKYKVSDIVWDCIVANNGKVTYRNHATGEGLESVTCLNNTRDKKTGGSSDKAPKTGDPINARPFGVMAMLGLGAVFCFIMARRKRNESGQE